MFPSIVYDKEHDILYIDVKYGVCDAEFVSKGIYVRKDMETEDFCGIIIEDFLKKAESSELVKALSGTSFKMTVVDKPPRGTIGLLYYNDDRKDPMMIGDGGIDFVCGKCSHVICKNTIPRNIPDCVFLCPECKSYNQAMYGDPKLGTTIENKKPKGLIKILKGD